MRAADLVALAAERGVDLTHVGGTASDTKGIAAQRKRTQTERELGIEVVPNVRGSGTRVYRRPTWSYAELGQAAQGLPIMPWYAARYSFAGDRTVYWDLWYGLVFQAQRIARRDGWAPRVMGRVPRDTKGKLTGEKGEPRFYLLELAQMVLDEDSHRFLFVGVQSIPHLHAMYMGVEDVTWDKILEPRYRTLQGVYERWLGIARGMIQQWLREDEGERVVA